LDNNITTQSGTLKLISDDERQSLLDYIDNNRMAGEQKAVFRNCLVRLYDKYIDQLNELERTIRVYEDVTKGFKKVDD
jgi:hypothetical protein